MYLGSDNYLGSTAYLGPGPNGTPEPVGDETLIQWRDITLHGLIGRFTIADLIGWDDLPDSRQQWDPRPNQHGAFDAPVYSSERHIMVAGQCFDRAQRDQLLAELKRGFTFGPHAEQLSITHAGKRLSVAARLVRFNPVHTAWGAGVFGWQAEFVAADPFRYGQKRMVYTGLPVKRGGLRYPLFTDGVLTGTSYAWTGTPGQSTSTETVDGVVIRENMVTVPRPRAGVALGPWSASYPAGVALDEPGPDGVLGLMSITSDAGTIAVRLTQSITGSEQTVYVSIQARSSVAAQMPTPTIGAFSGGSVAASVTLPAVDLPAGAWVEVSGELFVAGDFDEVSLIAATSVPAGESLDVTMGYVSTDPGAYFDGDTPDETAYGGTGILDYGEASDSGRVTLTNNGTADAWPTFQVRGPAPQGVTIANIETGRRIVSTTVIPSGSTLTIHTAKGTAYLDGADRSGQLTVREWTPVPPESEYTFQFSAPTYTSAALVASTMDTYW